MYNIVFVAKLGQTPGTMACGVKIVALDDAPVTFCKERDHGSQPRSHLTGT